jgi:hypothetical protein
MTKAQWIELVKRNLSGGDSPVELRGRNHEREIELYLAIAFDTILNRKNSQFQEMSAETGKDSWKWDALTKPYMLDIKTDTVRGRSYSDLPVSILSIVNNAGIRMVFPVKEESSAFLPRWQTDTFLMDGLDVNLVTGLIYYTVEGQKIYYSGDINCNWTSVMAKLVLKFNEFEDEDEVSVPEGKDAEILQLAIGLMQSKQAMDIVDDGTAMQTTK